MTDRGFISNMNLYIKYEYAYFYVIKILYTFLPTDWIKIAQPKV